MTVSLVTVPPVIVEVRRKIAVRNNFKDLLRAVTTAYLDHGTQKVHGGADQELDQSGGGMRDIQLEIFQQQISEVAGLSRMSSLLST